MALRMIFMGTPEFSVPILNALHDAGHQIVAVYSQPPRPAGRRGLDLTKSPVHQQAEKLGLPVLTPLNFKAQDDRDAFSAHQADVAVVVAYGLLLPEAILTGTRLGCYNGHASLLPRWRGAAPIQRAIMAGDTQTGMMVMKMDKGLDTGPIALTCRLTIPPDMTAGELHDALSQIGAEAMVEAMAKLEAGDLPLTAQPEDGTVYAAKIDKAETRIDFSKPATQVHNGIRGLSPFPGAWFEADINGKPERIKVLASQMAEVTDTANVPGTVLDDALTIACGMGAVRLVRLQKAGGKPLDAVEFLRGTPISAGAVFTSAKAGT
ncbi:methionyl-tRNA formyltransferase [Agrobacterium vitis]|uniref:Methionyl-tRNA formyltransferase n=1 Tax=Agrobacterium vitis TaxID=373 RepID=A0A368NYF6_AGRVI|nr:methionyl-tRNA formyltransferase [Agrobacterium vitis]KAA3513562.1 methionyl-tRNA formyltransferase [Agrobacterium vitis]KAA3528142.1 methionyl-tRNA formyltransferase [Agrobacterium vitis]MCF1477627.1 methionyl-tRNA formyltransferase [Agrobacterium vitis]MUZ98713.1 methionyl-tRNA formyltransferase [Agrobacterium vitis]MVA30463.1 methionyl-tRNA formyltransferase [Agrobacterium vitis]